MKKLFRTVLAVAVAAAAMTSCQKAVMEEEGGINAVVSFQASFPETKTTFGTAEAGKYPVLWQDGDKVAVSVSLTSPLKDLEVTPSTDKKTGTFSKDVTLPGEGPWAFYVMSPSAAMVNASSSYKSLTVDFATDQTPTAVSVDPAAQVLLAMATATTIPTEPVPVTFDHLAAYGKVSLTNLPTTAKVSGLSLAFDQSVTGRWYFYPEEEDVTKRFQVNAASKLVNLTTEKTADVFFAVAPNGVAVKSVKVTLKTEDGNYEKEVTVPEKTFKSGVVSAFTVDMTGASKVQDKVFKLVKNAANLAAGDQVIIANKAATSAISTTQQSNNRKGAAITPDASGDIVNPSDAVQVLTLATGATTGTFAFMPEDGKYLYAVKGSNHLKTKDALEADGSFTVTIAEDGEATILCAFEGENRLIMYNSSSDLFSCYKSGQTAVAIYKLEASAPKVVDVWVNDEAGNVPVKGGAESKSDEWLSYADGVATWTANTTNAPRTKTLELADGAKITVTQLEDKDFKGTYDFTSKIFCTDGFTTAGDKKTISGVAFGEPLLGETLKDGNNVEHKNVIGIDGLYHAGIIADAAVDIDYEAKSVKLGVFLDGRKAQKDANLTGDYQYVAFLPGVCATSTAGSFAKPWTFCNPDLGTPDYEWLWFETEDLETFTYSCAKVAQKLSTTGYSATPYILGICVNVFKAEEATSTNAKGNYNVVYQFNIDKGNVGLQFKKTGPYVPKPEDDPNNIDSAAKLVAFLTKATSETTADVVMSKDIDMKDVAVPSAAGFAGTFDGQNHTIKNLSASAPLFATLAGTVKNLTLEGTFVQEVEGDDASTAGHPFAPLANVSTGIVENVINKAIVMMTSKKVVGSPVVAGLVAYQKGGTFKGNKNYGSVFLTHAGTANVAITGFNRKPFVVTAGVVGVIVSATAEDCVNEGNVSVGCTNVPAVAARHYIGGVVGTPEDAVVKNCINKGKVTGDFTDATKAAAKQVWVGGVIGGRNGDVKTVDGALVEGCYNYGECTLVAENDANNYLGGIAGQCTVEATGSNYTADKSTIQKLVNCQNYGKLVKKGAGGCRLGGIHGGAATLENCTNEGDIVVDGISAKGAVGGLVGYPTQAYHPVTGCKNTGSMTATCNVAFVMGGLFGQGGNTTQTYEGCTVNCTMTAPSSVKVGIILGTASTLASGKTITYGSAEKPFKVKGSINGTALTVENFGTMLIGNPATAGGTIDTSNVLFGE